jgi:hypothetical protein
MILLSDIWMEDQAIVTQKDERYKIMPISQIY